MRLKLPSIINGCAVAVATVGAAAAATLALWQQVFSRNPFGLFYAAVMFSAWCGGLFPGLLATALAMLAIDYLLIPSFFVHSTAWRDLVQASTFIGVAVLVNYLKGRGEMAMNALRQAKQRADEANSAKDQFLAVLSHELRTPLTPALAIAAALERDSDLTSSVRADLTMLRRNIELEARLIDDLLDVTRITRGKLTLSLATVDLVNLIEHVIQICTPDAAAKGVDLTFDHQCTRRCVRGDAARLQQILWNLVKNAVKFTDAGGVVTVRCADGEQSRVRVEVSDTGVGIANDVLPRIFRAFEQGGSEVTRTFGGLGLGLAISAALAEAHQGTLTAASDGIGHGATFTLELDALIALPAIQPTREPKMDMARSLRLLLVEDHPDTSRVMARLLRSHHHHVLTASDVETALRTAENNTIDLVISDIGLPDRSGLELMSELRERYQLKGIALSGYGMEEDVNRSMEAGFDAHLTKPVNFDQLTAAITRIGRRCLDDQPVLCAAKVA